MIAHHAFGPEATIFTAVWVSSVATPFAAHSGSCNRYEPVHFAIVYGPLCCIRTVRRATIAVADVFMIRGEKIAACRAYFDMLGLLTQIGAAPR